MANEPLFDSGSDSRGRGYGDAFYASVADAYAELIDTSRHPAQDIAALTDAPITSVNRWVKEARRRGLLAPASAQGRPGGPRCSCRCPVHCPPPSDSTGVSRHD